MSKLEDKVQTKSPYNDGWTRQYYEDKLAEDIVENKEERYINGLIQTTKKQIREMETLLAKLKKQLPIIDNQFQEFDY